MSRLSCLLGVFLIAIQANADDIRYLARPEQALAAFYSVINGATSTIDIATFIYEPCDPSARVLTESLIAKAKAGVHVRVLLDAFDLSDDQQQQVTNEFAQAGIEFRLYSSSLFDIDLRMHAKFMVVDGNQVIAGGRNLADEYFDLSSTLNYVDRDFLAIGASGAQAEAGFNLLWNSDMVTPAGDAWGPPDDWNSFCATDLGPGISAVQNFLRQYGSGALAQIPIRTCNLTFNVDNPDFYKSDYGPSWQNGSGAATFMTKSRLDLKTATSTVINFVRGASQSLSVENYEYIPITALESAFRHLRKKGVPIQILTNQDIEAEGPDVYVQAQEYELQKRQTADSVGSEWVGLVSSQGALSTAFPLTPQGPPVFIHSKVMVRNNSDVLIGSFNLDARSANINVETASVVTACPGLAADVMSGAATIRSQYQTDQNSPNPPPKPDPSSWAQFFGDLFISQF